MLRLETARTEGTYYFNLDCEGSILFSVRSPEIRDCFLETRAYLESNLTNLDFSKGFGIGNLGFLPPSARIAVDALVVEYERRASRIREVNPTTLAG